MRKRTAGGKSTTRWRLSFWRFSIGFRIITALFHSVKDIRFSGVLFLYLGKSANQQSIIIEKIHTGIARNL